MSYKLTVTPSVRVAKRAIDLASSIAGLALTLPLYPAIAAAIYLESPGPIFYKQRRAGMLKGVKVVDGRERPEFVEFSMYKFRSMRVDAEKMTGAVLAQENDPRITRVGRFLRKTRLDELPQFWSVLVGDMSLVGPRPYLEREIKDMDAQEGFILRAPPGMTGLWQVSDRNAISFSGRVKMDVHYVRNWSPWIDIYILARTIGVVLRGTGM